MTQQHQNCTNCQYNKKADNKPPCSECKPVASNSQFSKWSNWKPVKVTKKKGATK